MASKPVGRPPAFSEVDVLDAALVTIKRDGIAGCSLRSVARELDVTAMAVYRHIESKDDLLSRLPDYLLGDVAGQISGAKDGVDALRRTALVVSRALETHVEAISLFARPVVGPNMSAAAEACILLLVQDGYERDRAVGLLRATVALVIGLAVTGGTSADQQLGPMANDALDVWLCGIEHPH